MTTHRVSTVREILRAAATKSLEPAWIYLRDSADLRENSECLVLGNVEEPLEVATSLGFPQEGLDTESIEDCASWAKVHEPHPTDSLLLYAFRYYWLFDAFPPKPWAADPPPTERVLHNLALNFYRTLGEERDEVRCKHVNCSRGAIRNSVLCRTHHYEMVRREPCPFGDDA
jgi:hypothetical protein